MRFDRQKLSWALYDWANSAFATTVMAGFFPLFFKQYWQAGAEAGLSSFRLGLANSSAALLVAVMAPILGAVADRTARKKRFLAGFAALGMLMTGALFCVAQGQWWLALGLYIGASVGFLAGNIFYDALLPEVAADHELDRTSALGFALGYLGGGLLFAFNVLMLLQPAWFGLADATEAVPWAFVSVSLWWALFSLPLWWLVDEPAAPYRETRWAAIRAGLRQLRRTLGELPQQPAVLYFLLAYWLYIDGVNTVVVMAVDYGMALGLAQQSLISALLLTQFVGFPAALLFGRLGDRFGPKAGIFVAIAIYMAVTVAASLLRNEAQFYGLAVAIGLVQGGVQSLSRSLYARLLPRDRAAEYFSFYGVLGKFAAILGPLLVGAVSYLSGSPRLSILSILLLFAAGAWCLGRVDLEAARRTR
ncbi:MFS transporter [Pseudomarimonas arenosa]|uniref:MFS transporter n=1 Tax=Pseudomarimonas arenosa TaxID=2774145 RepID=A0AAW3ZKU8_9GAMM|nr:MFS transporter [Pseudomarimonas arenosa]MBD8526758.1 MFS transporter [Pseudomarimonas arenosa]